MEIDIACNVLICIIHHGVVIDIYVVIVLLSFIINNIIFFFNILETFDVVPDLNFRLRPLYDYDLRSMGKGQEL